MSSKRPLTSRGTTHQIILDLLYDNLGRIVTKQQLREATGQDGWPRRLHELREDEGWQIPYSFKPQGYVMYTTERNKDQSSRRTSLRLRTDVFARDNYTCQMCGHAAGQQYSDGTTVRLEADHIIPFKDGGPTEIDNLQTLCSRCNAGKKAVIAKGQVDTDVSLVVRLSRADFTRLEQKAQAESIPVKELIRQRLRG